MHSIAPPLSLVTPEDLYIHAYDALKKEIAESVKDARAMERNSLLACGGILTYLAGRCPNPAPDVLWYVPLALALFGAFRTAALMISIRPRAMYLSEIEGRSLRNQPLEGWEQYFRSHYRRGVGITIIVFWLGLVSATAAIPRSAPRFCRTTSAAPAAHS